MITIEHLITEAKQQIPNLNEQRVLLAYEIAKKAHDGQKRSSGEAYIQHPLSVAKILLSLHPDEDTLIATLLHDVLEDTEIPPEEIEKQFGSTVRQLSEGVEKLSKIEASGEDRHIGSLRKMFLAMAKDIRVIFIKLCDRLHNMQTISALKHEKQRRIAQETLDIYAPIATRLGMYQFKGNLEDLSFQVLFPQEYHEIERQLGGQEKKRDRIISVAKKELEDAMKADGVAAKIQGRVKHRYSIYRKMLRQNEADINAITDIFALRIIANDEAECYKILGIIHKHWRPLSHRFKDYIAVPKPNGYQSLHTTILGLMKGNATRPIEIQIRTQQMHEWADMGAAAHWQYKEGGDSRQKVPLGHEKKVWLQALVDLGQTLRSNQEFSEDLQLDLFQDRIFVFTPGGDILDLPKGATPVDFAYAIHTSIGHTCTGAIIDEKNKPLNTELHNGEVVKILTKKSQTPNPYWLSFVVTSHAKQSIRNWLKTQDIVEVVRKGRELLNKHLVRAGHPELDTKLTMLKQWKNQDLPLPEREQLLQRIGNGSLSPLDVVKDLFPEERIRKKAVLPLHPIQENGEKERPVILIEGDADIETKVASCCSPQPGDRIAGVITRGRAITIHKSSCKNLKNADSERIIGARWSTDEPEELITINVHYADRIGILRDVTQLLADHQVNIVDIHLSTNFRSHHGAVELALEIVDDRAFDRILDAIEHIPNIEKVEILQRKQMF